MSTLNLGIILQSSALERPDRVALKLGERSVSYRSLDRAAGSSPATRLPC
jgi:non-ribosomal peptide synthetase component E (peptide arylation enzyme)